MDKDLAKPGVSLARIAAALERIARSMERIETVLDVVTGFDGKIHYIRTSRPE